MRVVFSFPARFCDSFFGMDWRGLDGVRQPKLSEDSLESYFDSELADLGVIGGDVYLVNKDDAPTIQVVYWYPGTPSQQVIHLLREYTTAQIEDGIGEGGFQLTFNGRQSLVIAETDEPGSIEVYEDGRMVMEPSQIAIAARSGDLPRLIAAIENKPSTVDQMHQGTTALHLAILFGHVEALQLLLAAGADPNRVDHQGMAPLETCALSNHLSDEQSLLVGKMLLHFGANSNHVSPDGMTARDYALLRDKTLLADIL